MTKQLDTTGTTGDERREILEALVLGKWRGNFEVERSELGTLGDSYWDDIEIAYIEDDESYEYRQKPEPQKPLEVWHAVSAEGGIWHYPNDSKVECLNMIKETMHLPESLWKPALFRQVTSSDYDEDIITESEK